jgi:DNA end-binding protein Ku
MNGTTSKLDVALAIKQYSTDFNIDKYKDTYTARTFKNNYKLRRSWICKIKTTEKAKSDGLWKQLMKPIERG